MIKASHIGARRVCLHSSTSMSRWAQYLNRTSELVKDGAYKMLTMSGTNEPSRVPKMLCNFDSRAAIQLYAKGCDEDIGGLSTVNLTLDQSGPMPVGKFWGDMRLGVRPELEGRIRGGYAGFRNMHRTTMFGEMMHDLSFHGFLELRVRLRGSPRTRNSYFVNIQTDGFVQTDLWQHRLYFQRDDGDWENVYIPLASFVLTNTGDIVTSRIEMLRERVRTVGVSLLGGNSGVEGPYELGIEHIRAVNSDDATSPLPATDQSHGTPWQRGAL